MPGLAVWAGNRNRVTGEGLVDSYDGKLSVCDCTAVDDISLEYPSLGLAEDPMRPISVFELKSTERPLPGRL